MEFTKMDKIQALLARAAATPDPEEQITIAMVVNRALKALMQQQQTDTAALRRQKAEAHAALLRFMQDKGVDCIETESAYVRLCRRTTTGRALSCKMVEDVLGMLTHEQCEDVCCAAASDAAAAAASWREKREKELCREERAAAAASAAAGGVSKSRKRPRGEAAAEKQRLLERVRARVAAEATELLSSDEPCMRGKGKSCPTRAPLVCERPSMRQLLRETLYRAVHGTHKVVKPVLVLDATPGRAKPVRAEETAVAAAADAYCAATAQYAHAVAALAKPRRLLRQVLATCEPKLQQYVVASSPVDRQVVRRVPSGLAGVAGTFKLSVVKAARWSKPLSMWDVSRVVNAAVDSLAASIAPDARARFDMPCAPKDVAAWLAASTVRDALQREVQTQLAALRREREQESERLRIRAFSERGEEEEEDDDDGEDEDENENENDDENQNGNEKTDRDVHGRMSFAAAGAAAGAGAGAGAGASAGAGAGIGMRSFR